MTNLIRIEHDRSLIDWNDDGNVTDYGHKFTLIVRGKHRLQWSTTKGTTRSWPRIIKGSDENCNRAITIGLWPLGHLDIWWETKWRPEGSGPCDACLKEFEEADREWRES